MVSQQQTVQTGDASGRGTVGGFKVPFPAKMQPYTKEEINAVVEVMAEIRCQSQGERMKKFE